MKAKRAAQRGITIPELIMIILVGMVLAMLLLPALKREGRALQTNRLLVP